MRVTVCELPHEPAEVAAAWQALCAHTHEHRSELLVLPEFAFAPAIWQTEGFDAQVWAEAITTTDTWLRRLPDLGVDYVIGARPVAAYGRHYNEGFLWSRAQRSVPLRRKYYMPDEPGGWETRWFARGDKKFPRYSAGPLGFGLNICTELWALETYGMYSALNVHAVICPRASASETRNKWLAIGTVAAVRSGAYCISSNRISKDGLMGGMGWIISPDGALLAHTVRDAPFATFDVDPAVAVAAQSTYPRYALVEPGPR